MAIVKPYEPIGPVIPKAAQTKAMRYNDGKPQLSYLLDFPFAVTAFARVCEKGAEKYARDNWKKGREVRETIDSLLRHVSEFQNGHDIDVETGCLHVAHAMWNCAFLLETLHRHGETFDDRDKLMHTEDEFK